MVDFSKFTKRAAGEAKKPPALPAATYPGVITGHELKEAPQGKDYETIIRFFVKLTDWAPDVDEADKVQDMGDGTTKPIDLSKRQLRRDFYDSSLHRLDDFLRSCGIEPKGRTYEEVLPEVIGKPVNVGVQQYMNQTTSEIGNQIGDLAGTEG